jgi:hypothetical protein
MYWEDFLEQNPDINIEDLCKPAEFKPPVKPKRTTPKGPGPIDTFIKDLGGHALKGLQIQHETEQKIREGLGETAKWVWNPNPDRVQKPSTQQIQRGKTTKYRQLGQARRSWQMRTQDQRIDSLSTKPNPGNTSPWKQENPIVPGSNADAGKWTGSDKMWTDSQESLKKGEEVRITPEKNQQQTGTKSTGTKSTDTKSTETKAQRNARISKGLSMLASALGDQSVKTHQVSGYGLEWDGYSGYV